MIFSSFRGGCCCSIGGGDECFFCWSLRDTCPPPCPTGGGPSGGNGAEDCDPETDSTCSIVHPNIGDDECTSCTYPAGDSMCHQFDLCPCVWLCVATGCYQPNEVPGGGIQTPCPIISGCPIVISNRLQCPPEPLCPTANPQSCNTCTGLSGTWILVQDPYASGNSNEPTCQCCCDGFTGQLVSC